MEREKRKRKRALLFVFEFWPLFQGLEILRYLLSKVVIECVEKCLNLELKLALECKTSSLNFNRFIPRVVIGLFQGF